MSNGNDPLPEDPDLPVFQDRGRWIWPTVGTLVAVLLVVWFGAGPTRNALARMNSGHVAKAGLEQVRRGAFEEAAKSLEEAQRLNPTGLPTLELAARYHAGIGSPEAVARWQAFLAAPGSTPADRREFILLLQDAGDYALADEELRRLLEQEPANLTNQLLLLDQNALVADWRGAVSNAGKVLLQRPDDPYLQFLLAKALIGTGEAADRTRATGLLRGLAKPGQSREAEALRTLAALPEIPVDEKVRVAARLEGLPKATLVDRILAAELRLVAQPDRSAAAVDAVLAALPASPSAEETALLGRFLRAHGRQEAVLALANRDASRTNGPLALIGIDALVDLGRWDEALARVTNAPALDLVSRQCTLALYANHLGRYDQCFQLLKGAATFAVSNVAQLHRVASIAENLGESNLVLEIWRTAVTDPRMTLPAADQLFRVGAARSDYAAERQALQYLLRLHPGQANLLAESAYINALHEERVQEAHDTLQRLLIAQPSSPQIRGALALAKLQLGDRTGALNAVEAGGVDWNRNAPRWQAVYAAVLEANQQHPAALKIAESLAPARLKSLERRLLQPILQAKAP